MSPIAHTVAMQVIVMRSTIYEQLRKEQPATYRTHLIYYLREMMGARLSSSVLTRSDMYEE
jgi:hypothetical protein